MSCSELGAVRVLHVTDNLAIGGVQRVVVELATASSRRGLVIGVAAEPRGELRIQLPNNVTYFAAPAKEGVVGSVQYLIWLRRTIRVGRWNIVHAHQRKVALLARLAVVGTGSRVVEHVHSLFSPRRLTRSLSFRGGHRIIACGGAVSRMLIDQFGLPAARVRTVPNGVADLRRAGDLRELPSACGHLPHLVSVGRVANEKDPYKFVEAIRLLNSDQVLVTAEWVGDGPLLEEVREYLELEPVPGLRFSGSSLDVRLRLLSADLLVMTSRTEGLPLVCLEAMSLGRGIVAPDVGGCRELVEDSVNGILFRPDATSSDVADLLHGAITNASMENWGVKGRELFEERGSVDGMVERVLRVYEEVQGDRRTRSTLFAGVSHD